MSDEVTIGELGRLVKALTDEVRGVRGAIDSMSDHFVPREVYQLERDESTRDRAALHIRLELVQGEVTELKKDTFSKKAIYSLLGLFATLAVAAGTLAAVFRK